MAGSGRSGRKSKAYVNLCLGWAIGSRDFKAVLAQEYNLAADPRALEVCGAREVNELRWNAALQKALGTVGKTSAEARVAAKSAAWKLAVAAWLKTQSDASNRWVSTALHLGVLDAARRNLSTFLRKNPERNPCWKALKSVSST